jgi:hypothetical protein
VATLRIGELPVKECEQWKEAWTEKFQAAEEEETQVKMEPTTKCKKKPRPKKKAVRRTPRTRPDPPSTAATSYQMVVAGRPSLPEVGERLESKTNAVYGSCTVTEVTSNFVHTDGLHRQGRAAINEVPLYIGTVVEVRLSPGADVVTRLLVLAIGMVWKATKTRALVFRRQNGSSDWGELETMK